METAYFRSSIDDFSGLPVKIGKQCMVRRLQGLFGLERARVSFTLLWPSITLTDSPSGPAVERAVPSGSTTTPAVDGVVDSDGLIDC